MNKKDNPITRGRDNQILAGGGIKSIKNPSFLPFTFYLLPSRERGSALLITIMITGLVIILAVALLGRIIPYSKQIRGMQDGLQSYYTARSQLELANQIFANAPQRRHIPMNGRINEVSRKIELTLPNANTPTYAIIAGASQIPSQISFSPGEPTISFGTSTSPTYHFINRNAGGMALDLTGINIGDLNLEIKQDIIGNLTGNISVEFIWANGIENKTFTGNTALERDGNLRIDLSNPLLIDGTNILGAENFSLDPLESIELSEWIDNEDIDCASSNSECVLKIQLTNSTETNIHIQILATNDSGNPIFIPDLNAIAVADGFSSNGLYHTRIIELIPSIQSL